MVTTVCYRVIRLDNGLVALLISAECTVARRIDSDKDSGLKGSSKCESCSEGESGEEEEEKMIVGGTSDDGENEDHVTCLGEADLPNDLAGTGGHVNGIRRRQDQSYLVSRLTYASQVFTANLCYQYFCFFFFFFFSVTATRPGSVCSVHRSRKLLGSE